MNSPIDTKYNKSTVSQWLDGMADSIFEQLQQGPTPALIGIRRGGVDVGRYLYDALANKGVAFDAPLGELNIAFYRDDFSSMGLHPVVGPSHVPFDVTGRHIVLIDDVLGTGRTIRAAMNEIFDYGRPAKITLAVLAQRQDHELPIRADVIGQQIEVGAGQYIDLDADSLELRVGPKP